MSNGRSVIVVEKNEGEIYLAKLDAIWEEEKKNIFIKPNGYVFVWNWIISTLEFVWVFKKWNLITKLLF